MGNVAVQESAELNLALERSKMYDPVYAEQANTDPFQQLTLTTHQHHARGASKIDEAQNGANPGVDPVLMAMLYMMDFVNVQQQTASIQVKQLQSNASMQMKLNNQDAQDNFVPLTTKALYTTKTVSKGVWGNPFKGDPIYSTVKVQVQTAKLNAVGVNQSQNQRVQEVRDSVSDQLIILRQNASVGSTQVSTTMDQSEQTVSAFSSVVNLLNQVTQQINQR